MSVDAEAAPDPRNGRRPRLPGKRRLLVGLALAGLLVVGAGAWASRHSDVPFDDGYGIEGTRDVGFTVWTTLADSDPAGGSPVTFTSLEPRLRQDGAAVEVEYVICELDPVALEKDRVGGFGYGLPTRVVERLCASTGPAEGGQLVLGADTRQELLVGITATRPGRTVISGHQATYRVGWWRGSRDIAVTTRLTARRSG